VARARKGKLLPRLTSDEGASVLRSLLDRHPELVEEAEENARAIVTDVDAGAVADEVEQAVLDLEVDELLPGIARRRHPTCVAILAICVPVGAECFSWR
jgi:hypothetical protein